MRTFTQFIREAVSTGMDADLLEARTALSIAAMRAAFPTVMRLSRYANTFILPDGTILSCKNVDHAEAVSRLGWTLEGVFALGVIRQRADSVQTRGQMTAVQAQVCADYYNTEGYSRVYVDNLGFHIFETPFTADALRNWVNADTLHEAKAVDALAMRGMSVVFTGPRAVAERFVQGTFTLNDLLKYTDLQFTDIGEYWWMPEEDDLTPTMALDNAREYAAVEESDMLATELSIDRSYRKLGAGAADIDHDETIGTCAIVLVCRYTKKNVQTNEFTDYVMTGKITLVRIDMDCGKGWKSLTVSRSITV